MQSDRLNIFANADVDLKTEKLVAEFNTVPQKGLGISLSNLVNPYVNVTGTLANPEPRDSTPRAYSLKVA